MTSHSLYPAALLALGLAVQAAAQPAYRVGPQPDGSTIVSILQRITPSGVVVNLGAPVRAKAVAVAPGGHVGAVLQMGASSAIQVFDTRSGAVLQRFSPGGDRSGSYGGIAYAADGKTLYFSQDSSNLAIAGVDADGRLAPMAQVSLPATTAVPLYTPGTAYPGGLAVAPDGRSAYVLLNQNNTLGVIDLTRSPPLLTRQVAVGNAPHSVVLAGDRAYVSNEGGQPAMAGDFTDLSSGTPIVTDPATDSARGGSVSVVDLAQDKVVASIAVGLHPTGMALSGPLLFVANAYSDSVSVIDTASDRVLRSIAVGVPLSGGAAYGTSPNSIAVDGGVMYVALGTANAIAVVDLSGAARQPVMGYIPTAYYPSGVVLDAAGRRLIVACDKGTGTRASVGSYYGVTGYNTHQDSGTVEIIPLPTVSGLAAMTRQVIANNHWDRLDLARIGPQFVDPAAKPKAIPDHIGEPSLIRHVFLIIKENRTYDQVLGDVKQGDGDAALAVFAAATPNQHKLVRRFPLLDNVYAPSRQSADGHPWIVSSIAAYADEIQSPDWIRSYPGGNSNDAMVYTPRGFLWQAAQARGLDVRMYGEWSGHQAISGTHGWAEWYKFSQWLEGKIPANPTTLTTDSDTESTTVPSAARILDPHYPSFNLGIPDQYRVDEWLPIFRRDEAAGKLPSLTILWLPDDHTSGFSPGFPVPSAAVADNDLALGRIVDAISHSRDWPTTAIFVEEDDAQNGIDHVDGHRQPVYVISPYAVQGGPTDHTAYTAENINRTIEQILGLMPLTQFDLVADPMRTAFTDTPDLAPADLAPWDHVPNTVPLDTFPSAAIKAGQAKPTLPQAWALASIELFRGKIAHADAVDANILNHIDWYAATGFKRPYPGEISVRWPSDFVVGATPDDDGDGL